MWKSTSNATDVATAFFSTTAAASAKIAASPWEWLRTTQHLIVGTETIAMLRLRATKKREQPVQKLAKDAIAEGVGRSNGGAHDAIGVLPV